MTGVKVTENSRCFLLVKASLKFVERCSLAAVETTLLGIPLAQNEKKRSDYPSLRFLCSLLAVSYAGGVGYLR